MSKEFFELFPTLLGIPDVTTEIHAQLGDTSNKKAVQDRHKSYVEKYYPIAYKVGKEFGMNPIAILAQAAIESGWGTSQLARENNNFFGVTAYGKPNDYWKGAKRVSTKSGLPFRSYDSAENGFRDFVHLIAAKYKTAFAASNVIANYAQAIAYSPYINEKNGDNRPNYKKLIIANAALIDLYIKNFQSLLN